MIINYTYILFFFLFNLLQLDLVLQLGVLNSGYMHTLSILRFLNPIMNLDRSTHACEERAVNKRWGEGNCRLIVRYNIKLGRFIDLLQMRETKSLMNSSIIWYNPVFYRQKGRLPLIHQVYTLVLLKEPWNAVWLHKHIQEQLKRC